MYDAFRIYCNRILSTGVFPDYLKYSEILPLFKSGSKDKIDSYRPISLLASFSKIQGGSNMTGTDCV
jgi:hypothetical protein